MHKQRGDTIVEVIFAVTVFSLVAVGGLTLMNQGAAIAQRSLEIGLVREQMDAQAEALRYIHNAYISSDGSNPNSPWKRVTSLAYDTNTIPSLGAISTGTGCTIPNSTGSGTAKAFALDIKKLDSGNPNDYTLSDYTPNAYDGITSHTLYASASTYSKVRYPSDDSVNRTIADGLWIQAVKSSTTAPQIGYYDFYIMACWTSPGQSAPVTLGTIVRLYDA